VPPRLQNGDVLRSGFGVATADAQVRSNGGHVGASAEVIATLRPRCASRKTATATTTLYLLEKHAAATSAAVHPMVIVSSSQILVIPVGKALQHIDVKELHLIAEG
jgi:hypothetical protein